MALVPYDPKRVSHGTLPFAFVPDSRDEEKWDSRALTGGPLEVLAASGGLKRKDDEQRQLAEVKKLKKEKEVLEKEKEALEAFYLRQLAEQAQSPPLGPGECVSVVHMCRK